ncbi:MAG: hypothetical protein ABIH53_03895, partial [archaeon]
MNKQTILTSQIKNDNHDCTATIVILLVFAPAGSSVGAVTLTPILSSSTLSVCNKSCTKTLAVPIL